MPNQKGPKPFARWDWEDIRIGGGVGYGFYLSNQMDYAITTNFGNYTELIPSYQGGVYKTLNKSMEFGLQYRHGHLFTLKSENTQGMDCDFDEGQFNFDYSLNHNAGLHNGNFTANAQLGLGVTSFKAKYYAVDPVSESLKEIFSSIGYNGSIVSAKDQPNRQLSIIGNVGLVLGFRISQHVSLYWENTVNISTSNKMTGNLFKKSWIPPDGYYFSGISLYINFGSRGNQLGCPKF